MNRRIVLALALVPFVSLFSFPEVKPNNRFAENAGLQSDDEIRDQVQEFAAREGFLPC